MLKSRLTKVEHESLQDAVKEHYKADGDGFVLDADGLVAKTELDASNARMIEFRENNKALNLKAQELETLKAKFKDVDPVEYARVKGELEALKTKGITKPDDITAKVEAAVIAAVKPLSDKLEDSERKRQDSDTELQRSRLRTTLTTAAIEGKVRKNAVNVVVDQAMAIFDMDANGTLKAKDGNYSLDKPAEPITMAEWLTVQAKGPMDYAFEPSKGGGAPGEPGTPPREGVRQVTTRDPKELGASLEDLASGKAELA